MHVASFSHMFVCTCMFSTASFTPNYTSGMHTAAFLGLFCVCVHVQSLFMVWDHMKRCHLHSEPYLNTEKKRWPHI